MKLGLGTLLTFVFVGVGCGAATDDVIIIQQECGADCGTRGAKSDDASFVSSEIVDSPTALCHIEELPEGDGGELHRLDLLKCQVMESAGFLNASASVYTRGWSGESERSVNAGEDESEVTSFNGESQRYPVVLKITVNFNRTAISPSSGDAVVMREESVVCEHQIESASDTFVCGTTFERRSIEVRPDGGLQDAWDAGEHRAASLALSLEGGEDPVRWSHVVRKGQTLGQSFDLLLPTDGSEKVSLRALVPLTNGADGPFVPLPGGGVYELHADGTVTLAK